MIPPQLHMSLLVLFRSGFPHTSTVGAPGTQGAAMTGAQGMGVSAPMAAAVAAATVGLAILEHIPKVGGWLSMMVHWGILATMTVCWEVAGRGQGVMPKEQVHMERLTTGFAIETFPFFSGVRDNRIRDPRRRCPQREPVYQHMAS